MSKPKPQPPKPELVYEVEGAPPKLFLIWYAPDEVWWRPNEAGYTTSVLSAGTYPEADARELVKRRSGDEVVPLEQALREELIGVNPVVLQAIAAMGGR
jgi:hypothetical protein